jgi:hypothetical protein
MSTLKATIEALAAEFAANVIAAMKSASLEEIMSHATHARGGSVAPREKQSGKRGARLPRRSPEAIEKVRDQIVQLLAKHPKGLRSEEIQSKLGITSKEIPRPLSEALSARLIAKKGAKRSTTYFKRTR